MSEPRIPDPVNTSNIGINTIGSKLEIISGLFDQSQCDIVKMVTCPSYDHWVVTYVSN